jgi:hypothetical protein
MRISNRADTGRHKKILQAQQLVPVDSLNRLIPVTIAIGRTVESLSSNLTLLSAVARAINFALEKRVPNEDENFQCDTLGGGI